MASPTLALVPKRISLFEHVRDVEGIADLLDALDASGDLTPEIESQLQRDLIAAVCGTKEKIDRTTSVLAQFEAQEKLAKDEAARLKARADRFARQRDYLERSVMAVLTASNLTRIDGHTSSVVLRTNPPAVLIDAGAEIPAQYLRPPKPPEPAPDKVAIKAALQRGELVPGCRIVRTTRLEVQ